MMYTSFIDGPLTRLLCGIILPLAWSVAAFPALGSLPMISTDPLDQSLNISGFGAAPPQIHCDDSLGKLVYSDCDKAIGQLPHDPIARPVLRNFYTASTDMSSIMPNQQLPFRQTYGGFPRSRRIVRIYHANNSSRRMYCSAITCNELQ